MKKIYTILIGLGLLFNSSLHADEGMWLPTLISQLNMGTMTELGLKLSAEDIYNINESSLKDAIVALDHGSCTAELVSDKGLLLTNHHCGYGEIQEHSSEKHDYLSDGFWAMSLDEELPNPGKTATLLIKMEDVTDKIMSELSDSLSEQERWKKIEETSNKIIEEEKGDTHYEVRVESLFRDNKFYLFVYETFLDVRLVGAPPSTIGKFGGDIDNWMWPRHTGDFSMFRIYTGPDGKPAEYSKENIPYVPKHHIPVSLDGVEEGDFAMVFGYPGRTQRYLTSYGVKNVLESKNPGRIKIRTKKLELMKEDMDASNKVRIQYASKYSRSANYWKSSIGQNKGLKRLKVYDKKKQLENEFVSWVNENDERKAKYGEAIPLIENAYKKNEELSYTSNYIFEAIFGGGEILSFTNKTKLLYKTLKNDPNNAEAINSEIANIKSRTERFFKDYNAPTDKKITAALLKMYYEDVDKKYHPSVFSVIEKKYKGSFEKFVDHMFAKSIFVDEAKMNEFLNEPYIKTLEKDPPFQIMLSFADIYYNVFQESQQYGNDRRKGERLFLAGLAELLP